MNLRQRIDAARGLGIAFETAVIVSYRMGLKSCDPKERDNGQLTEDEKQILTNEGLLGGVRKKVRL